MNPWKVLGVHRKSTDEQIHQAFIKLAKRFHPDNKKGADVEKFHEANLAYRFLKTKETRRHYIEEVLYSKPKCDACAGTGVEYKQRGFAVKEYIACVTCCGAGLIIKTKEENKDVAIELRGTVGAGSKGRNKGRSSGPYKRR